MVVTRSSHGGVEKDENRIIAVVTGANSGFGLGICHQLLSNLSLPPGAHLPASTPQRTALAPTQQHLLGSSPEPTKDIPHSPPPTLTLILACRSESKAEEAKETLMRVHRKELKKRQAQGMVVRLGWLGGLRIIGEKVDFDCPGGKSGTLAFCQRMKMTYPHITSLFINAGLGAYKGTNYPRFAYQVLRDGLPRCLAEPAFGIEIPGAMSSDGERGLVWGVNVLAPYILAKELGSMLQGSPPNLPFPPRIIYTSSCTSKFAQLKPNPLVDYQLLSYGTHWSSSSYKASKYMADIMMVQLDKQMSTVNTQGGSPVRVLTVDPGCACTNIWDEGFGAWRLYRNIMKFFYWLSFVLARWSGSRIHMANAEDGALSLLYAALISERYLQSAEKVPAQRYLFQTSRSGRAWVAYGEVDRWEDTLELGEGVVRACEAVRAEWRRREGLE